MPVFADPTTKVVYQPIHPPSSNRQSLAAAGQPQHQPPPTMAMVVVQNNPQPQTHIESLSNLPLPPGMEIVLGDKKYTIQYQSYEMTREKATEYIAKCTGTPYSRMSSPPDPVAMSRQMSDVGVSRAMATGGTFGAAATTAAAPVAMTATTMGNRETLRISSPTIATTEEQQQRLQTPDEVYTTITSAASGLSSTSTTRGSLQQPTTGNSSYPPLPTYAPPPPTPPPAGISEQQQQHQNLGYYWEDGVWKVWKATSSGIESAGVADNAAAKMPPPQPIPVQHSQHPPQSYPPQHQPEPPQYQYSYSQQPSQQQQQPQQTSFATTSAAYDPASYGVPHSQQQQPLQIPQIRGPPLPSTGFTSIPSHASGGNILTAPSTDPTLHRYI